MTDGSLDSTFGTNGIVTTPISVGTEFIADMIIQPDGKIVVGGRSYNSIADKMSMALARYLPNGTLDTTFSGDGILVFNLNATSNDMINALAIQSDGKIVAAGSSSTSSLQKAMLVRIMPNGILDNGFGTSAMVLTSNVQQITDIALQTDGKIVAVGNYNSYNLFAIRYHTDGTLDSSFGANGIVETLTSPNISSFNTVAIQADGKILCGGNEKWKINTLFRYNTNGTLDSSFGTNGKVAIDLTYTGLPNANLSDITLQPDGKILATGTMNNFATIASQIFITRYNTNGTLDSSFMGNGTLLDNNYYSYAMCIELQTDGKIVIGGITAEKFGAARYFSGLSLNISNFSPQNNNISLYPNPINAKAKLSYSLAMPELLSIELVNQEGEKIHSFMENCPKNIGKYEETLSFPPNLAQGIYFIRLSTKNGTASIKITK
jgi:uncharacterized delta-60 repeat protein